jgi:TolA-binding protein
MSAIAEPYNKALYDAGYQSYTSENYADAIAKLLPIVKKDPTYRDGYATYYLAQSYRKNGNVEEAKQYYQYIIDNYPGTERANTAKNYVN